jgi:hypothetical protein
LIIKPTVLAEVTVTALVAAFVPDAFPTVRVTVKVPAAAYVWVGFWLVLVPPSPKFQDHVVGDPVDASVNCTDTFAEGDAGEKVKEATGLDDGEEDDDDEDESPQAETTSVPSRMTNPASQARQGCVRLAVMDAS